MSGSIKEIDLKGEELQETEVLALDAETSAAFRKKEIACVWKLDLCIAPIIGAFNLISFLDRSNIGFAATQGMSADINLVGQDLNMSVSLFYVFYTLSELPISMVAKRWRFERVLPTLTICFGAITLGGGFVQNNAGLLATRLLLGLFEGCLFPCLALFIANWYKREELATRMAFLFGSTALSGAFAGLLAYAIYHMNGLAGLPGWRWIYIIEGIVTIVYGVACYWLVPSSFETAYFLNEDDKMVMRHRAELTQQYSGGTGHFTMKDVWLAASDTKTWIHGLIQFCVITPAYGFNGYLPIIIENGLHFSTVQAQYLTIPVQTWGCIIYIVIAMMSDRFHKRFLFVIIFTPICALGYVLLLSPVSPSVQYFACFLITTGVYIAAGINLAWAASNAAPDGKRGATVGIVLTLTDCAGIVIGQLYPAKEAPHFYVGNGWSLGVLCTGCLLFCVVYTIYKRREAGKEAKRGIPLPEGTIWDDRAPDYKYQT